MKPDGHADNSGTIPSTLRELMDGIGRHLLLEDQDVVPVMLAAVAAHSLPGEPVWLLIVGPSGGAKTELIRLLWRVPCVFPLSELTARTFASGLKEARDPSLLARLKNEVLALKDFTSVLEMHREERQAVLAQLREIYDGRFDKVWGTGKEVHWQGRLGFVAGVTPVIDRYHAVMALLGARFLVIRPRQPDRLAVGRRAIANGLDGHGARDELMRRVAAFLGALPPDAVEVPEAAVNTIARVADFVARARSGVDRNGYTREIESRPEPEMPGRLAGQFSSLARGLARISARRAVADDDTRRVVRVGLDCIPPLRRSLLAAMETGQPGEALRLAQAVRLPTATVRRALDDLDALGLATRMKRGSSDLWTICPEWSAALKAFSEMSAEKPHA